ncbi:MAG: hypothetical protein FWE74_08740 [Oscillospiraceae bacterium]|nr:hypothetical protein [Oscillospiraceae bacterium]
MYQIIFTEAHKQQICEEFAESLNQMKMSDGKLSYSKTFNYSDASATVWLTPQAYKKTLAFITEFSDEVAWHWTVVRDGDSDFIIEDIFVYPQEVTGSTVNTDQEEYSNWLYGLDDEVFPKIRMQDHSHVNMGVSPSGVDERHRQQILEQLEPNMFYIFMVWNKSLSVHTLIYDMQRNILYEDKDVEVRIIGQEGMDVFLADAREKVQKRGNKSTAKKPKNLIQTNFPEHEEFPFSRCEMYEQFLLGGERWIV